jgi:hypothetical protein
MKSKTHTNEFVNLVTFNHKPEAEALKSMLLSEGVMAQVQDETNLQKYWFWAATKASIHVQVIKERLENAQKVLSQPQATHFLKKAVHCPSCHSMQVQYPDLTRKNFLPTLLAQLFVLLRFTEHKYYCESCHFVWLKAPRRAYARKKA